MEPIYCQVRWCDKGKGAAKAKYFCETEKRYVCEEDTKFCHNKAHRWRELNEQEAGGKART
jgi:hypothetical protein